MFLSVNLRAVKGCDDISDRYIVLVGPFGSGKSELALNYAVNSANSGGKTALVDLDIVSPYFRSAEQEGYLHEKGITLIESSYVRYGVDLPIVPAAVASVFIKDYSLAVFDVGGDVVGATALGQFHQRFQEAAEKTEVYYVVNVRRPRSGTPEDIIRMFSLVQEASRIKINGFINNSNLAMKTDVKDLLDGAEILRNVTEKTGIPVYGTSGQEHILSAFADRSKGLPCGKLFPVRLYTRPEWLDKTGRFSAEP